MRIQRSSLIVAGENARVAFADEDGEVHYDLPIRPGVHTGAAIMRLTRQSSGLTFTGDVSISTPYGAGEVQHVPGHFESAANPAFNPGDNNRRAEDLERRLLRVDALERAITRKLKAFQRANMVHDKPEPPGKPPGEGAQPPAEPEVEPEAKPADAG